MKNSKVERIRQKAMMFGRLFLQGDVGVFDQAFARSLTEMADAQVPSHRERIYAPLDTLRLFVGQALSADRACQDVVGQQFFECPAHAVEQAVFHLFVGWVAVELLQDHNLEQCFGGVWWPVAFRAFALATGGVVDGFGKSAPVHQPLQSFQRARKLRQLRFPLFRHSVTPMER